jgi:hypothetical protein
MKGDGNHPAARAPAFAALWVLPMLFLAASALLSSQVLHERSLVSPRGDSLGGGENFLYQVSIHPAFAFGFRNFLGDLAWLGAVQVAGSRKITPGEYDRLYILLKTVGNFDPRFVVPSLLGGIILGDSPGHAREALDILDRGAKNHPADWRFPFYIGYTWYFSLGDPLEGAKALEEAARLPESPPYLPLLAARMFAEGRAPETALTFLERMVREETDPARLEILNRRIGEVIVERDIQALEKAVVAYTEKTGGLPGTLSELVRAGLLRSIPEEPHGGAYVLAREGTVSSTRLKTRLKVFRKR